MVVLSLSKAQSLLTLEITGNECIDCEDFRKEMKRKLRCRNYINIEFDHFFKVNLITKALIKRAKARNSKQIQMLESMQLQKIKESVIRTQYKSSKTF